MVILENISEKEICMMKIIFSLLTMILSLNATNYEVTPLVTDPAGSGPHFDPNLINPWGLFFVPNGNFWVSNNGADVTTLYQPDGTPVPFVINLKSFPTGGHLNSSLNQFLINGMFPAKLLFVTENGTILGFNSSIDPLNAVVVAD